MRKIRLGLTMGDPGGIGPEIILKTLCEPEVTRKVDLCVIGPARAVEDLSAKIGISPLFEEEAEPEEWTWRKAPFLHPLDLDDFVYGRPAPENGSVSLRALETACHLVMGGYVDGIVTAPISKEAWHLAGSRDLGHTDFLARLTGQDTVLMMTAGSLRVSLVTGHVPLRRALDTLDAEKVAGVTRVTHDALVSRFGFSRPRLALAGLNPHAGEGGLCGDEEKAILEPARALLAAEGMDVSGPAPPDAVFREARDGKYDAVVSLYHDQGLIPVKLHDFFGAVNVTLGLPFIRTSPGHGTAFDIAGRGEADHRGMMEAVHVAADMARRILFP